MSIQADLKKLKIGAGNLRKFGLAVGGAFVGVVGWLMRRQALVPLRDPRLSESLAFENA